MPDQQLLRELQTPLKELYARQGDAAVIVLSAEGEVDFERIGCRVPLLQNDGKLLHAGLHPAAAGNGLMACSGELLLQSLITCAGTTVAAVATAMGFRIDRCEILAKGTMDFRGTMGVDRNVPVGIQQVDLLFRMTTSIDAEQAGKLVSLTERYCVVYQTLAASVAVSTDLELLPAAV